MMQDAIAITATQARRGSTRRAFTLIELLICIAVIAVLIGLLLPGLAAARETARHSACMSNQRQMVIAWQVYADTYRDYAVPTASQYVAAGGVGVSTFWWGTYTSAVGEVDPETGYLSQFIDSTLNTRSVYECPSQPWGSYTAQPVHLAVPQPTSTYGYNGYYLAPTRTPGWASEIGFRPWRKTADIRHPSTLFVFADTLLPMNPIRNSALLDPPELFTRGWGWYANEFPTTAFRHGGSGAARQGLGSSVTARADGAVRAVKAQPEWLVPGFPIGSVTTLNAPHYVPDAAEWR